MKRIIFLMLFSVVMASCTVQRNICADKYSVLPMMIDGYYDRYYEYPDSADELIDFYNVYSSVLKSQTLKDNIETSISCLQEEKDIIRWKHKATYPWKVTKLLVKRHCKTLVKRTIGERYGKKGNGGLAWHIGMAWSDVVEHYVEDYFRCPATLEELIDYSGLERLIAIDTVPVVVQNESAEFVCAHNLMRAVGFRYFQENKKDLVWHSEDSTLLIVVGRDTVYYREFELSPCHWYDKYPMEKLTGFYPRFYDTNGRIVNWCFNLEHDLVVEFRRNTLRFPQSMLPVTVEAGTDIYHFLVYTSETGLSLLCKDDDMITDTDFFRYLKVYVKRFADENGFSKVVFVAPAQK